MTSIPVNPVSVQSPYEQILRHSSSVKYGLVASFHHRSLSVPSSLHEQFAMDKVNYENGSHQIKFRQRVKATTVS